LSKYWLNFKSSSNVVKEIFAYGNSHAFQTQTDDRGKKKDTDDYQFKSGILGQKAGLLTSGRTHCRITHGHQTKRLPHTPSKTLTHYATK
jgi:hypothetical protein